MASFQKQAFAAESFSISLTNKSTCTLYIGDRKTGKVLRTIYPGGSGSGVITTDDDVHVYKSHGGYSSNCGSQDIYPATSLQGAQSACLKPANPGAEHRFTKYTPNWYAYSSESCQQFVSCNIPWGGTIQNGQSITAYASNSAPFGSSCSSQTRTCNNGSLSGSYSYDTCSVAPPSNCSSQTIYWGAANSCSTNVSSGSHGATSGMLNNNYPGAIGSASAVCYDGIWKLNGGGSCTNNLSSPANLYATDGTLVNKVQVSWGASGGATSYVLNYRKQGEGAWTSAPVSGTSWTHNTTDESVYEYRVAAKSALGESSFSNIDTGYIFPPIDSKFISQIVPKDVLVSSTFNVNQTWKNTGANAWDSYISLENTGTGYNFDVVNNKFASTVSSGATASVDLKFKAPATPGVYSISRKISKGGRQYGEASKIEQIKVWPAAACGNVILNKTYTYDIYDNIVVSFDADDKQLTLAKAEVKTESSTKKEYTVVGATGKYQFTIPLKDLNSEFGVYNVNIKVENPVSTATCGTQFEVKEVEKPGFTLTDLIGKGVQANSFVVGQSEKDKILKAEISRTEDLDMLLSIQTPTGEVVSQTTLNNKGKTIDLEGVRWEADAWSSKEFVLRIAYADPGVETQGKNLNIPILLILSPNGNTLSLDYSSSNPLRVTSVIARIGASYDAALQGEWQTKVAISDDRELDSFTKLNNEGKRNHNVNYSDVYGKTLEATAWAIPANGVVLRSPLELKVKKIVPVMPVLNLDATDGTLEDSVKITWDSPVKDGVGFSYTLMRENDVLFKGKDLTVYEDTPPERGKVYSYKVITHLSGNNSENIADPGHVPLCRAVRLIGATLNADMTAINGMIEQWACLDSVAAQSGFDSGSKNPQEIIGSKAYRSFKVVVPADMPDGKHVLNLHLDSDGVVINKSRDYNIDFNLNRASIAVKEMKLIYGGADAVDGLKADSVGRFGIKVDGGSGIGFAEPIH